MRNDNTTQCHVIEGTIVSAASVSSAHLLLSSPTAQPDTHHHTHTHSLMSHTLITHTLLPHSPSSHSPSSHSPSSHTHSSRTLSLLTLSLLTHTLITHTLPPHTLPPHTHTHHTHTHHTQGALTGLLHVSILSLQSGKLLLHTTHTHTHSRGSGLRALSCLGPHLCSCCWRRLFPVCIARTCSSETSALACSCRTLSVRRLLSRRTSCSELSRSRRSLAADRVLDSCSAYYTLHCSTGFVSVYSVHVH